MRIFVKLVCLENKQDHFFQNSKVRAVVVYSLEKKEKKNGVCLKCGVNAFWNLPGHRWAFTRSVKNSTE